jgi:hypothetical protein
MLERDVMRAQQHLDQVHVWGWRWREPYNRLVPERKVEVGRTVFTTTCALSAVGTVHVHITLRTL